MTRILFICHGNICRSPMAEFILKALVKAKGLEEEYCIESAAVSDEEYGNPIYPPARRCLSQHSIWFDPSKTARTVTRADYERFDRLICMDSSNLRRVLCSGSLRTRQLQRYRIVGNRSVVRPVIVVEGAVEKIV